MALSITSRGWIVLRQRKSCWQLWAKQTLQLISLWKKYALSASGRQRNGESPGSLRPKIDITGILRLAAMWTGPESLEMNKALRTSKAAISAILKTPLKSKTLFSLTIDWPNSFWSAEVITPILSSVSLAKIFISSEKFSWGQRLVRCARLGEVIYISAPEGGQVWYSTAAGEGLLTSVGWEVQEGDLPLLLVVVEGRASSFTEALAQTPTAAVCVVVPEGENGPV